jgi:hypothetical protein
MQKQAIRAIIITAVALALMAIVAGVQANDVRYCTNIEGEVIIVRAPYLCPPGTWEM